MREALRRAAAVAGMVGMVAAAAMLSAEETPPAGVEGLGFLAGYWKGTVAGAKSYEEQWMPPAGGTMVGCARTVNARNESFLEFASITVEGGAVRFTPYPGGRKGAVFTLMTLEENHVVFVAPENDFPKLIEYRRVKGEALDRLVARITDGSEPAAKEFVFNLEAATP